MKIMSISNINLSIEELENNFWGQPQNNTTGLVEKVYKLRKKKINEFDDDELRFMITQNIALEILIPIAIKLLKSDIFLETLYYEGDLFYSVLCCDSSYWDKNIKTKQEVQNLINENYDKIDLLIEVEEVKKDFYNILSSQLWAK